MVVAAKLRFLFQTAKCFWKILARDRKKIPARLTERQAGMNSNLTTKTKITFCVRRGRTKHTSCLIALQK